jgi:hypothetical protein
MTFINDTISSANPGPALYTAIETAMLAGGWTLEDTVVIGSTTHKILKSAAAGNTYGLDWYLDINYPTTGTTGGMRFAPFEGYNAGTDQGTRGPFGHVSVGTIDATTYSRFGATASALETNWMNGSTATGVSAALATTPFGYYVSVTRNRIVMLTTSEPTKLFYTGFFTPSAAHVAHAGAALFPLVMLTIAVNSTAGTAGSIGGAGLAFTRVPKASTINWSTSGLVHAGAALLTYFGGGGLVGGASSEFAGETQLVPCPVMMGAGSSGPGTGTTNVGGVGYLDGVAAGYVLSTATAGASVAVGSDTWYTTTPSGSYGLFFKGV